MKSRDVETITTNEEHVRLHIFDGDLPIEKASVELLRIERAQHAATRRQLYRAHQECILMGLGPRAANGKFSVWLFLRWIFAKRTASPRHVIDLEAVVKDIEANNAGPFAPIKDVIGMVKIRATLGEVMELTPAALALRSLAVASAIVAYRHGLPIDEVISAQANSMRETTVDAPKLPSGLYNDVRRPWKIR